MDSIICFVIDNINADYYGNETKVAKVKYSVYTFTAYKMIRN